MDYQLNNGKDYSRPSAWIDEARRRGEDWDLITFGKGIDGKELEKFLKNQQVCDWWPEMNIEEWKALVNEKKEIENRGKRIYENSRACILTDPETIVDNKGCPVNSDSCWLCYKKKLHDVRGFSQYDIDNIERASIEILNRLSSDTSKTLPVKGLVIGNVQSGKTANMGGLIAMAADYGWNMFIILSGTIDNLREQTESRLYDDLSSDDMRFSWHRITNPKKLSKSVDPVSKLKLGQKARERYLIVSLKQQTRLSNLLEWLHQDINAMSNLRILLIDDEADQASINTHKEDKPRTKINRLIMDIVNCWNKNVENRKSNTFDGHYLAMNYICYTATPYANCLNENGEDSLYPRDFIDVLPTSEKYIGPDKMFESEEEYTENVLDIIRTIPSSDDKKTLKERELILNMALVDLDYMPTALQNSILWFLCSVAIFRYWGKKDPVSMLINISVKNEMHNKIDGLIRDWLLQKRSNLVFLCKELYEKETKRFTLSDFLSVMPNYDSQVETYPLFENIRPYIEELISYEPQRIKLEEDDHYTYSRGIHLCIDNSSSNISQTEVKRIIYPSSSDNLDFATAFIVIGGNTLSRGLTLKGLVSSYFLRSSSQMDTLMQMGRWFGYRIGYELLPRIWMTDDINNKFKFMAGVERELRDTLFRMKAESPDNFKIAFRTHPKVSWLKLTDNSKMQSAVQCDMDFSAVLMQTFVFDTDIKTLESNMNITEKFINSLGHYDRESNRNNGYVWSDVPFQVIKDGFLGEGKYKFAETNSTSLFQRFDLAIPWASEMTEKGVLGNWNIMVLGLTRGTQDESRIWSIPNGLKITKINRSRLGSSKGKMQANIGALIDPRDGMADAKVKDIPSNANLSAQEYRAAAKLESVPALIIYCIDKNSMPQKKNADLGDERRVPLGVDKDIIGIAMIIPPTRNTTKQFYVTIKDNEYQERGEEDE